MAEYTPGYVDVPGKGKRYRNASGEYFHNHFGSILNSFGKAKDGVGAAYNNYYDGVADAVGTERRDGTKASPVAPTAKPQKPAAPAKPVNSPKTYTVSGVTYDTATGRPVNAPQGGYSVTPGGGTVPHTSGGSTARTNPNGIKQYGKNLSSLNAFTSAFTGGYELADIKTAFQSNDLPMKGSAGTNTDYSVDDAVAMGATQEDALKISEGGFVETLIEPSTPGTLGNNPSNSQDGTSSAPTIADNVRTLRMQRKGPRDDGSFRGFQKDNNNRLAQMPKTEAPDPQKVAQEQRRNKIRSTFLDMDTPIIQASIAANAQAGYGKDRDGNAQFNYGGELVQAKDGMQQQAKNAAMMGKDPSQFLDIKIKEVQDKEKDK